MYMDQRLLTLVVGLAVGSFANVLIDRIPRGQSIGGRSQCDRCRRTLQWWELVPIVSAVLLRYRCPTCRGRFSLQSSIMELGGAALGIAVFVHAGEQWGAAALTEYVALAALAVLAVIDARTEVVPDVVSIPAIGITATLQLVAAGAWALLRVPMLLVTMVLGGGWFVLQRLLSRGRWVGDGDIRVGALMGALLPLPLLGIAFASAYIVGGAWAAVLLLTRRAARGAHIPLVPFLAIGTTVAVFWGDRVLAWYGLSF